ncbi:sperm flagellar protein 1-like isoform X2 [Saccostrea echinata]|uniref:sperm flagellar protein 1-like isoform X2 n=1 Tax=Saccostrea echinata TaxID=191078 RepID=UPI002A80A787|nr:sperm flagellar protein 1-like isoform X2 [Saccostrea echinata]
MSVDKIHPVESGLDYFDDEELENLYTWIDSIPLSRPKKNVARDFADGVLVAEIVQNFFPQLVQMHNYTPANATNQKKENWLVLNRKVFKKLNFELSDALIRDLVNAKPGTIELLLRMLKRKIEMAEWEMKRNPPQRHAGGRRNESDQPEADQNIGSPGRSRKGVSPTRGGGGYFKRHADSKEVVTLDKLLRPSNYTEKPKQRRIPAHLTEANSVPRLLFEDKVQECLAKDETIEFLKAKVRRLERLIQLKDVRIDDLQNRVESMRPTGNLKR